MTDEYEDPRISQLKQDVADLVTVIMHLSQALSTALTLSARGNPQVDQWHTDAREVLQKANTFARQIAERATAR